jgi:hypothetical protein
MAYIAGLASPSEIAELKNRGWLVGDQRVVLDELLQNVRRHPAGTDADQLVIYYVDNELYRIMTGPGWPQPPASSPTAVAVAETDEVRLRATALAATARNSMQFGSPAELDKRLQMMAADSAKDYLGRIAHTIRNETDYGSGYVVERSRPIEATGIAILTESLKQLGWSLGVAPRFFSIIPWQPVAKD